LLSTNKSKLNTTDLTGHELFTEDSPKKAEVAESTRIDTSKGKSRLLRFYLKAINSFRISNSTFGQFLYVAGPRIVCGGLSGSAPQKPQKTIRDLIYWQYAKIIGESAGFGKKQFAFVMDLFKKLQALASAL
jgi:hypothetical protein